MADQSTYKLMASTSANGAAAIDIRADGTLEGVLLTFTHEASAAGSTVVELSWIPTTSYSQNDSTSPIATLLGTVAAASDITTQSIFVACNVKVTGGERIYLNTQWPSGTGRAIAHLYIADVVTRSPRTRR